MNIEQQRAAFEASVIERNSDYEAPIMLLDRNALGDYSVVRIAGEWEGWKAAIELARQGRGEPVAEVVSAYGDPEAFGERYLKALVDVNTMPYGTKFYRHPQPAAPTIKDDEYAKA